MAGLARALHDPSIPMRTVHQVAVVQIFEAPATAAAAEAAMAEALLVALEMDNGKMVSTSLALRI